MNKRILIGLLCSVALPCAAFDPLFTSRIQPPKGCIDKDITHEALSLDDLLLPKICAL